MHGETVKYTIIVLKLRYISETGAISREITTWK